MQRRSLLRLLSPACVALSLAIAGCAAPGTRLAPQGEPDVLLLGERHDAPGQIARVTDEVNRLAAQGRLAALAIEMAPAGTSTVALPRGAGDAALRGALGWNDKAWPWERYAPAIRAAAAAGVPVVGANLPREQMRTAMEDVSLDAQLGDDARAQLATALREGHCGLLPEARIAPMLRVQIARDRSMAHTVAESAAAGRTVVLLAGAAHADGRLGVPQHLPIQLTVRSIALVAEGDPAPGQFDARWSTPAAPAGNPCAALALRQPERPAR